MFTSRQIFLCVLGAYLIVDGVVSFYEYRSQHWYEQAVRVVRTGLGIAVIYLSIKYFGET